MENIRWGRRPLSFEPLRRIMETNSMGSLELSLRVGCNRNHLNKILAGKVQPRRELALRLAETLGVNPRDIWWPKETKFTS